MTLEIYNHLFPNDLGEMADRLDDIKRDTFATHSRHGDSSKVVNLPNLIHRIRCMSRTISPAPGERLELSAFGLTVHCSAN